MIRDGECATNPSPDGETTQPNPLKALQAVGVSVLIVPDNTLSEEYQGLLIVKESLAPFAFRQAAEQLTKK